jgi:DNA-directed RNA polymerase specialized sigma24 family protein
MRLDDDRLLSMARRGEDDAVARFATRFWTPVFRFALNMLGNPTQAAAVTEETIFLLLESGSHGAPVRVFVFRTALHFVLLRRRWAPQPPKSAQALRGALQRLSDFDRAALLLRDVEVVPAEEAAAILRTSPADVRARAHRGRLLLMNVAQDDDLSKTG